MIIVVVGSGLLGLNFESGYKIFFGENDYYRVIHEEIQSEYTDSDNIAFIVGTNKSTLFTAKSLQAIEKLTSLSWDIPYAIRVDSITNFQHTDVDGDNLTVRDLIENADSLSRSELDQRKKIALNSDEIVNAILSPDGKTTLVNVSLIMPELNSGNATQEVISYARKLKSEFKAQYPELEIHLIGITVADNAFSEMAERDSINLFPFMFLLIISFLVLLFRSIAIVSVILIVVISTVIMSMGAAGWLGIPINQISVTAPTIVMTLAICDCVHICKSYMDYYSKTGGKIYALSSNLRFNIRPVFLTSLSTAVGFLSMNFSESPPFRDLGNVTAIGISFALLLSYTMLPALLVLIPGKPRPKQLIINQYLKSISAKIIRNHGTLFLGTLVVSIVISGFMLNNSLNDDTVAYFDTDVPFRQAADYMEANLPGANIIEYTVNSGSPDGIHSPEFLRKVDAISSWVQNLPEVTHVSSYVQTLKRINRDMHVGDQDFYRLPESREMASQYTLLYELSLPFGLDFNNRTNFNKSGLKMTVQIREQNSSELITIERRIKDWVNSNYPDLSFQGSGVALMFAHIGHRNIESMLTGSLLAILFITITLIIAMRSLRLGMLCLVPNTLPAASAFCIWGIFYGEVNVAVAVIFSITLGIIVDDTVHFMSKYHTARKDLRMSALLAVDSTISSVGPSLVITTLVLAAGFSVLALSSFNVNAYTGVMVSITIVVALLLDLLLLPGLLIKLDKFPYKKQR